MTAAAAWRAGALAVVLLAIAPRLSWVGPNEDSGVIGAWAMQVAAGQVPYRDFFMFTTPGSVLLYAAAFKLFGATYLVERLLTAAAILVASATVFALGRRVLPPAWAAAVAALWGTWLAVYFQYGPHHFWGVTCLLLMALAIMRRRFLAAGIAAGAAAAFIQSVAPAVLLGLVAAVLVERGWRRSLLPMVAGGAAVAALLAAWLLAAGAFGRFLDYAVLYSLRNYSAGNQLPFPWLPAQLLDTSPLDASGAAVWTLFLGWPLVVVLPIACGLYAASGLARWRARGDPGPRLLLAVLSTGLFLSVLSVRLTAPLGWFAAPLALLLLAAWVRDFARGRAVLVAPALAVLAAGLVPVPLSVAIDCRLNARSAWRPVAAAGGTMCVYRSFADGMQGAREFVVARPATRVAFLPVADSYYLFTGATPTTTVLYYIPGVTPPDQAAELERSLVAGRVEYVLYFRADLSLNLPGDRALFQPGPTEFDRLLERDYERDPAADAGGLPAWRLKASAAINAAALSAGTTASQ